MWEFEEVIDSLEKWIAMAKEDGFNMNDIVILGRNNKVCNDWAKALTQKGHKVISSESLMVDNRQFSEMGHRISFKNELRSGSKSGNKKLRISMYSRIWS